MKFPQLRPGGCARCFWTGTYDRSSFSVKDSSDESIFAAAGLLAVRRRTVNTHHMQLLEDLGGFLVVAAIFVITVGLHRLRRAADRKR